MRKIRRIRAWTSPKYYEDKDQYTVSRIPIRRIEGTVEEYSGNIEDIKRGPYNKKAPIRCKGTLSALQSTSNRLAVSGMLYADAYNVTGYTYLGSRKKIRLDLKNDMPPRNK
ncbi:hypothetical protein Tco_0699882 [Tanacetum coccineum]